MLINIIIFNYIYIIKHEWEKERNNSYRGFCYIFIKYFIQFKYFRKKSLFLCDIIQNVLDRVFYG